MSNRMTAATEQQPTVKDCLTVQPIAYAVFAANGNVVCFSTQRDHPSLVALEADGHSVVSLAPIAQTAPHHSDDAAVDRFAAAMKTKLAAARAKGRSGWDDAFICSDSYLSQLLVEHLGKGNAGTFEDVANFAMMLHQRGADPKVLANASAPQPEQSGIRAIHAMILNALDRDAAEGKAVRGEMADELRAALSAQGGAA